MFGTFSHSFWITLLLFFNALQAKAQESTTTVSHAAENAIVIQGINTAGTVRVNSLGCLEALFNIVANGCEILGITIGLCFIIRAITKPRDTKQKQIFAYAQASIPIVVGLMTPTVLNWLIAAARDAKLFS